MIRRNTFFAALMLSSLMAAAPASHAVAQEAITLETIGAVRMLPPQEVERMSDATARQQQPATAQQAAPQQSTAAAD